jgi:hypothetical protein
VDQIAVAILVSERFAQLLQSPRGCGMRRDIQMQQPARAMFNYDKDVEHAEGRGHRDEEVAGDDRASMIA